MKKQPLFFFQVLCFLLNLSSVYAEMGESLEERLERAIPQEYYLEVQEPFDPVFRHEFSVKKNLSYLHFEHSISRGTSSPNGSEVLMQGELILESSGNGTAVLRGKNAKAYMRKPLRPGEKPTPPMPLSVPEFSLKGLQENGISTETKASRAIVFEVVFPLPSVTLKVGQSVKDVVPFITKLSSLEEVPIVLEKHITLKRYVAIGRVVCAEFDVRFRGETRQGDNKKHLGLKVEGLGKYYFDISARKFLFSAVAIDNYMQMKLARQLKTVTTESLIRVNLNK